MIRAAYRYCIISLLIIFLDRLTKSWAFTYCVQTCTINRFLSFSLGVNRGISWSFFHSESGVVFGLVSAIVAAIILILGSYTLIRWLNHQQVLGEIMVLSGALSNLIDRIWYHGVIDFIVLSYNDWIWPAFNIADACIVSGVGIMFLSYMRE